MTAAVISMRKHKKWAGGGRAGPQVGDPTRWGQDFGSTGSCANLGAACRCRGAGWCSTCCMWDLRLRLAELVAAAARGA